MQWSTRIQKRMKSNVRTPMELTREDKDPLSVILGVNINNFFLFSQNFGGSVYCLCHVWLSQLVSLGMVEHYCIKQEDEVHTPHYWVKAVTQGRLSGCWGYSSEVNFTPLFLWLEADAFPFLSTALPIWSFKNYPLLMGQEKLWKECCTFVDSFETNGSTIKSSKWTSVLSYCGSYLWKLYKYKIANKNSPLLIVA